MTFLELCKKVRQECGIQGEGKPVDVTNQVGLLHRVVGWTRDADLFIQAAHSDWGFHWNSIEKGTLINSDVVSKPPDLKTWDRASFGVDRGTVNGRHLGFHEYEEWRENYNIATVAAPSSVTIAPDNNIRLNCPSDKVYQFYGEYWINPRLLISNDQVPLYREEFQRAIIEKAKMYFFEDVESIDQWRQASEAFSFWMMKLENQYLPMQQQSDLTTPVNQVVRPA